MSRPGASPLSFWGEGRSEEELQDAQSLCLSMLALLLTLLPSLFPSQPPPAQPVTFGGMKSSRPLTIGLPFPRSIKYSGNLAF